MVQKSTRSAAKAETAAFVRAMRARGMRKPLPRAVLTPRDERWLAEAFASGDRARAMRVLGAVGRAVGLKRLAEELGCSRPQLSVALSGRGNPTLSMLLRVCAALDLELIVRPRQIAQPY